jgi:cytochrome c biogenesis protein CcmG, thiol:disulfide interchange protein DsbE
MKHARIWMIALVGVALLAPPGQGQSFVFADGRAEYDRGLAALKIGNSTYAIQQFRRAIELNPENVLAVKALAKTAKDVKRRLDPLQRLNFLTIASMRSFYSARVAAAPANAVYQWALGMFDDSPGETEAELCFNKAITLNPKFAEAYEGLASTLAYQGDLAGARINLLKVHELSPADPETLAAYTLRVGDTNIGLYKELMAEFLKTFPTHPAGADIIARLASNEADLTARIALLEKLKSGYPPNENETTEWYMRFLYDAYNRTTPALALALAQEMSLLMPRGSEASRDWQDCTEYAQAIIMARSMLERNLPAEGAKAFAKVKRPYLISPDPEVLLRSEIATQSGKTTQAYQILVEAMAEQPSEALQPALASCGARLKKAADAIEKDIWNARNKKTALFKDFGLLAYGSGKKVRLSDYGGRVVLLRFWEPGDGVSRDEFAYIQKMLDKYGAKGLIVIAINMNPWEDGIASVITGRYGFVSLQVPAADWGRTYGVGRLPQNLLIDRQGRAVFGADFWGSDPRHTFELEVEALLGRPLKSR